MEQLTLSHVTLAETALIAAEAICDSDPLVHNEKGVVAYSNKE
jgi:anaphase-promoting complex subunit 6